MEVYSIKTIDKDYIISSDSGVYKRYFSENLWSVKNKKDVFSRWDVCNSETSKELNEVIENSYKIHLSGGNIGYVTKEQAEVINTKLDAERRTIYKVFDDNDAVVTKKGKNKDVTGTVHRTDIPVADILNQVKDVLDKIIARTEHDD